MKQLIALLAVTTCCLGNPAMAVPSVCWIPQVEGEKELTSQPCDVEVVKEGDTNYVYIYTPSDDATIKLAFYYTKENQPYYVQLMEEDGTKIGTMFFEEDEEGDLRVYNSSQEFYFRVPEERPAKPDVFDRFDKSILS